MRQVGSFAACFAWLAHRSTSRWSHGFLEAFGVTVRGYQRSLSCEGQRTPCALLRRFLLDLDAKEANDAEGRTIAEVVELFLETDAHPRNEE